MAAPDLRRSCFKLVTADVRDARAARDAARDADVIVHLAAQVAVTTSVTQPREDFEINALGTFNMLEGAGLSAATRYFFTRPRTKSMAKWRMWRSLKRPPVTLPRSPEGMHENNPWIFIHLMAVQRAPGTSTCGITPHLWPANGGLPPILYLRHAPVRDRRPGLGGVVCHRRAAGRPITIYGDGKQVRDVLFIDDLLDAYDAANRASERSLEGFTTWAAAQKRDLGLDGI